MDGTLLNSQKQIDCYTREVLAAWAAAGHKLVLCSGRDINSVSDVKKDLQLDLPGMYLIGYNGGQIYDCEKKETIYRITLTLAQTRHLLAEAERQGVHLHTYSDTHILAPKMDEEMRYYQHAIKTPLTICENLGDTLTQEPCKCLAIELKDFEKLENFRLSLLSWAEREEISMVYSSPYYLEFIPAASGKGAAVKTLCKILDIPPHLSLAAGDAQNDMSMIEAAGIGIAMINGSEDVKFAATLVTAYDNDNDGLAHALIDFI
ncbi:MAG: Cof-type HAD-IIB family hydrolase [Clostridium sp.]|nr:Cof-type HAD-IIB family hydrolase [Clostridium sp.]